MSLEFRCPSCGKLLRTPDDAAGRQARCPQCGAVADVPAGGFDGGTRTPEDGGRADDGNPFSTHARPEPRPDPAADPAAAEFNPYQSPVSRDDTFAAGYGGEVRGLQPTRMDLGDAFSRSWQVFQLRMGITIGGVVLMYVIIMGFSMVQSVIQQVAQVSLAPLEFLLVQAVLQITGYLFQLWTGLGMFLFVLRLARGEEPDLMDLFRGGRYYLPALGASLLVGLAMGVLLAICLGPAGIVYAATQDEDAALVAFFVGLAVAAIPACVIALMFGQSQPLIVDRQVGAVESLRLSKLITTGNKLSLFALAVLLGIINLGGLLACCVGLIFTGPFTMLTAAVAYLAMTGQPTAADVYRLPQA